jgi:hypothetical protein
MTSLAFVARMDYLTSFYILVYIVTLHFSGGHCFELTYSYDTASSDRSNLSQLILELSVGGHSSMLVHLAKQIVGGC